MLKGKSYKQNALFAEKNLSIKLEKNSRFDMCLAKERYPHYVIDGITGDEVEISQFGNALARNFCAANPQLSSQKESFPN